MQSLPKPQTRMTVTKTFKASSYVPASLMETYQKQKESLDETVTAIADVIRETPDYKALTAPEIPSRAMTINPLTFTVRHTTMVDGLFREVGSPTNPEAGKGFIEASTLNLLLSTKLLTDAEKRAVLKARNLIPESDEEEGGTPSEITTHELASA